MLMTTEEDWELTINCVRRFVTHANSQPSFILNIFLHKVWGQSISACSL